MVDEEEDVARHFSMEDLRDLFKLNDNTCSETHEKFKCRRWVAMKGLILPFLSIYETKFFQIRVLSG